MNESAKSRHAKANTVKIMPLMHKGTMGIDAWIEKKGPGIRRSLSVNPTLTRRHPENRRKTVLSPANGAVAILCRAVGADFLSALDDVVIAGGDVWDRDA